MVVRADTGGYVLGPVSVTRGRHCSAQGPGKPDLIHSTVGVSHDSLLEQWAFQWAALTHGTLEVARARLLVLFSVAGRLGLAKCTRNPGRIG